MSNKICKTMKRLCTNNINGPYDGNISFKPKCSDIIYISPGGVAKYSLKKKMINKIKIEKYSLDKVCDRDKQKYCYYYEDTALYYNRQINSYLPSGEIKIHTNIMNSLYKKFYSDDIAIIHCHPANILAYMGLETGHYRQLNSILNLFPELPEFIKIAPNVKHISARTEELADTIIDNINGFNFIGLHNHGIVCYADNFDKCIDMITTLDYYCGCALKYYKSI
jgi:ribulose-5-phosphate 4-epimerase/fuculose-1-phosphate aldolase